MLRYELITEENIILASKIQLSIFKNESAYWIYKKGIEDNHENYKYYLVYNESVPIGITGLYPTSKDYQDKSIWLGWFGVLEEYRLHGFGKQILKDTIAMAKSYPQKYNIKYFRLYTSYEHNSVAQIIYRQLMDMVEFYNNKEDINYNNTCLIYTKSLNNGHNVRLWKNKYLGLNKGEEEMAKGFEEFKHKTNNSTGMSILNNGQVI